MQLLVFVLLLLFFVSCGCGFSVDSPGAMQHIAEVLNSFIGDQAMK